MLLGSQPQDQRGAAGLDSADSAVRAGRRLQVPVQVVDRQELDADRRRKGGSADKGRDDRSQNRGYDEKRRGATHAGIVVHDRADRIPIA